MKAASPFCLPLGFQGRKNEERCFIHTPLPPHQDFSLKQLTVAELLPTHMISFLLPANPSHWLLQQKNQWEPTLVQKARSLRQPEAARPREREKDRETERERNPDKTKERTFLVVLHSQKEPAIARVLDLCPPRKLGCASFNRHLPE